MSEGACGWLRIRVPGARRWVVIRIFRCRFRVKPGVLLSLGSSFLGVVFH